MSIIMPAVQFIDSIIFCNVSAINMNTIVMFKNIFPKAISTYVFVSESSQCSRPSFPNLVDHKQTSKLAVVKKIVLSCKIRFNTATKVAENEKDLYHKACSFKIYLDFVFCSHKKHTQRQETYI